MASNKACSSQSDIERRGVALADLMNAANRDRLLTVRWNNALAAGLGVPALIYVAIVLSTSAFSDRSAFVGLVVIGAFY